MGWNNTPRLVPEQNSTPKSNGGRMSISSALARIDPLALVKSPRRTTPLGAEQEQDYISSTPKACEVASHDPRRGYASKLFVLHEKRLILAGEHALAQLGARQIR